MDASSPSSEGKVCIVCQQSGEYLVFVVNLKWKSGRKSNEMETLMKPTVRLEVHDDSFFLPAVCVLGSTLYVFDGYKDPPRGSKSMYTRQLSDGVSNLKLGKRMMCQGPSMHGFKDYPRATPTPCGKILVFSSVIDDAYFDSSRRDFELYDPATGQWQELPSIVSFIDQNVVNAYPYWVRSFTFMEKDVFFVNTELGDFILDIKKRTWKAGGFCSRPFPTVQDYWFVLVGKDLCLIPWQAHDLRDPDVYSFYRFPELSEVRHPREDYPLCGGVILLEENRGSFSVCLLQVAVNETGIPELLLQVYCCSNVTECKEMLSECRQKNTKEEPLLLPATTKASSLRILVEAGYPVHHLFLHSYFSIPPVPANRRRKSARLHTSGNNKRPALYKNSHPS